MSALATVGTCRAEGTMASQGDPGGFSLCTFLGRKWTEDGQDGGPT